MSFLGPRAAVAVRPHRSHRTLRVAPLAWLTNALMIVAGLVVTYLLLRLAWPLGLGFVTSLVSAADPHVRAISDSFLGITATIPVPAMPRLLVQETLWVAGGCVVLLLLSSLFLRGKTPLHYWFIANLMVLLLASLYGFFSGSLAYDSTLFMLLVERTSILIVLVAPVFCGVVSALLPFSITERIGMLILCVVFDSVFALVRIGAFALLVGHFGVLSEANLYLFLGPLMDVLYFIALYSMIVVSLSRRLANNAEAWEWL